MKEKIAMALRHKAWALRARAWEVARPQLAHGPAGKGVIARMWLDGRLCALADVVEDGPGRALGRALRAIWARAHTLARPRPPKAPRGPSNGHRRPSPTLGPAKAPKARKTAVMAIWDFRPSSGTCNKIAFVDVQKPEDFAHKIQARLDFLGLKLDVPADIYYGQQALYLGTCAVSETEIWCTRNHLGYEVEVIGAEHESYCDTVRLFLSYAEAQDFAKLERKELSSDAKVEIRESAEPLFVCECNMYCDEEITYESDIEFVRIESMRFVASDLCADILYQGMAQDETEEDYAPPTMHKDR